MDKPIKIKKVGRKYYIPLDETSRKMLGWTEDQQITLSGQLGSPILTVRPSGVQN